MEKNDKILDSNGIYLLIDGEPLNSNLPQEASFYDLAGFLAPFYKISTHDLKNNKLEFEWELDGEIIDNDSSLIDEGIDKNVLLKIKFIPFSFSNFQNCKKFGRVEKITTVNIFKFTSVNKFRYIGQQCLKNINNYVKIFLESLSNRIYVNSEINKFEKRFIQEVIDEIVNNTNRYLRKLKSFLQNIE